jgi:hypothetical protein
MLERSLKESVQVKRDAQTEGAWVIALNEYRNPYVAPWGTRACERDLRRWSRDPDNWMAMGAFSNLIKKVVDTPWIIDGPKTGVNRSRYFQDILRQADFGGNGGSGWEVWLGKGLLDLCRQNGGWYFEKIGPGDPMKPLTGALTGIAHLDSLRCYPTGDPEFPVIYYNYNNERHILHYTRVGHIVDMPDGDEFNPGYGYSPLYRSMGIVYQQWLMMRYNRVKLDELPAPGFASIKGMSRQTFEDAVDKFVERRANDTPPAYGNLVTLFGLDAALPVELTLTTFSQAPEGFDYPTWLNVQANALALTIGVDKQDIWELATRGLGTGAQSEVLHEKSQAKMYGFLLATIERVLNDVLPESCEFQFKPTDTFASLATAQTATAWATYTQTLGTDFTPNEKRALQAAQVPAAHDVLMDDAGQMIELPDADVKPETDVSLTDATTVPGGDTAAPAPAPAANSSSATVSAGDSTALPASKEIDATRASFEADFSDLLVAARSSDVNRRRFGVILRDLVRKYGRAAYQDGLVAGGIADGAMDEEDQATYAVELAKQSAFVTNLGDAIYQTGISDAQAAQKAAMWFNGSIAPFYDDGLGSADRNGYYTFQLGAAEHHCVDCPRLDGQTHRFKDWQRKNLLPGRPDQATECKGFNCQCSLTKADPGMTASGNW